MFFVKSHRKVLVIKEKFYGVSYFKVYVLLSQRSESGSMSFWISESFTSLIDESEVFESLNLLKGL